MKFTMLLHFATVLFPRFIFLVGGFRFHYFSREYIAYHEKVGNPSKCWDHEQAQDARYMIPLRTAFLGTLYDSYKKE